MTSRKFSIFDCTTGKRVSKRSYTSPEEANHDYYMNQGHTYIGAITEPTIQVANGLLQSACITEDNDAASRCATPDAELAKLRNNYKSLLLLLTNCRNGLELLLQSYKPERVADPFDTINELRETVRVASEAIARATP